MTSTFIPLSAFGK